MWRERAACAGKDLNLFFDADKIGIGMRVCTRCTVHPDCLRDQLDWEQRPGVIPYGVFAVET